MISSPNRPVREDYTMVRVDHQFSDSDFLFARYNFDDANLSDPDEYSAFTVNSVTRAQYVTIGEKRIFSPTVLNEFRAGFSRNYSNQNNFPTFDATEDLFFIPGQQMGVITFRSPAITLFGGGEGYPRRFGHNVWQLGDDMTVSMGSHTFKMGMLYERTQSNATVSRQYGGQYYFQSSTVSGLENFLRATPVEFQGDIPASDNVRGWRQNLFGFYFQDDFQVRSNLTLNLGLRYEFTTVPTEVNGKISNFPHPLTDTEPTVGDPWYQGSYKDFAPRVGLSWDPWGNGKTAIRAGFGMYFDHLVAQPLNRAMTRIAPYSLTVRLTGTAAQFPRVDPSRIVAPPLTALVNYALQNQMMDPTKIGYSFSIQQEIAPRTMVNVAYAGSHSYHQLVGGNGNNAIPQIVDGRKFYQCRSSVTPCPAASFPLRRNPNLGQLQFMITPEGSSTYHSLQLSLNRRFSNGLQLQASYTHAKYLNDSDAVFGRGIDVAGSVAQDSDNLGAEHSLASFDIRNYFSFNYTYDLPLARNLSGVAGKVLSGWQLNGIVGLANGTPVTVLSGFNRSLSGASGNQVTDRPDLLPGFEGKNLTEGVSAGCNGFAAGPVGTPDRYFDLCAFGLPPEGFLGNLGRNTMISPGLANFDFALMKNTSLTESKSLQFRVEFFNLLNRPNFSRPGPPQGGLRIFEASGARIGSSSAIQDTITDPRRIQLGLKLTF